MKQQPQERLVEKMMQQLSEHFDTVQIFTTRHEEGETSVIETGAGNWFARYGHVRKWVDEQEQEIVVELEDDEDEDLR